MNDSIIFETLLLEKNINQQQLSELLCVKKQSISQIITGKRRASKQIKDKIVQLFPDVVFPLEETKSGKWFEEQRKSRGLTQQEFADMLGISQSLCTKIENGERNINKTILRKIKTLDEQKPPEVAYINYCPNLSIPDYSLFTTSDKFAIDKRAITLDNFDIEPNNCFAIRAHSDDLQPLFNHGDMLVIVTSIKVFKTGHIFFFNYEGQNYIRKITLLPDKIKCASLNSIEDTFYIRSTKGLSIIGMIIPNIRL